MKTKLLFIYVLCFLFSCGISAQQSQKGWFKIGKAKKTVPIATQSQNTQSAQSALLKDGKVRRHLLRQQEYSTTTMEMRKCILIKNITNTTPMAMSH